MESVDERDALASDEVWYLCRQSDKVVQMHNVRCQILKQPREEGVNQGIRERLRETDPALEVVDNAEDRDAAIRVLYHITVFSAIAVLGADNRHV